MVCQLTEDGEGGGGGGGAAHPVAGGADVGALVLPRHGAQHQARPALHTSSVSAHQPRPALKLKKLKQKFSWMGFRLQTYLNEKKEKIV